MSVLLIFGVAGVELALAGAGRSERGGLRCPATIDRGPGQGLSLLAAVVLGPDIRIGSHFI